MAKKNSMAQSAGIIGKSPQMKKVFRQIRQAASADIPVLLIGETGTGKDLAAQAIHKLSERHNGPYIPVNLGSIPSELTASELFGHEKGAFTGANSRFVGKFEQSDGGTIFLDEIDSISEKVQISLLRLLEQRQFNRIGGKRSIRTDTRLIAATNADIDDLLEGEFRNDLFYRLDVFRIQLPPLRNRKSDITLLVKNFLAMYNRKLDKRIGGFDPDCITAFKRYDWPGNVRELKNVIQRAVLVCDVAEITQEHLPPRFRSMNPDNSDGIDWVSCPVGTSLDEMERRMIVAALAAADDNRTRAAELLGISRRAIYNKLKKHDLM